MNNLVDVIICAAGKGLRAGFSKNKLLVNLDGEQVLKKTLSAFDYPAIHQMIVAANEDDLEQMQSLVSSFPNAKVVLGGKTRTQSVYNALQAVTADIVLIHDGARPFVSRELIESCIESVRTFGSGVCSISCADTVAVCKNGAIASVPSRNTMVQIQTPQGFFTENIKTAYTRAMEEETPLYTDDSSVFLRYCGQPKLCKGSSENIKLTYATDFNKNIARCGFGIDTHAFGKPQDYIWLASVKIPSDSGLIAHSDGDVLCHAVMDALLSAAGLRDIGFYFPDSSLEWKDADSMQMLAQVVTLIEKEGYAVKNISVAIQAEKPRLAKYIEEMKNALANALQIDATAVGVTAGTNEGLGYVGEGKGITVHAYALLKDK